MHKLAAGAAAASCLLLCSCAATVTLPVVDLATSETAATQESSSMGLVLPQADTSIPVWLAYAALQATPENAFFLPDTVQLNVENILQNPELPNGCEITSAAIVLNYLGFDIDKVTLAENCLPMHIPYWEADPEVEFMGSPADELSFYCLPGAYRLRRGQLLLCRPHAGDHRDRPRYLRPAVRGTGLPRRRYHPIKCPHKITADRLPAQGK